MSNDFLIFTILIMLLLWPEEIGQLGVKIHKGYKAEIAKQREQL